MHRWTTIKDSPSGTAAAGRKMEGMDATDPGTTPCALALLPTGVPGLDEILEGGLARERMYLVRGDTGAGKTTLGLQFLFEGVRQGEPCLLVSLAESAAEVATIATSHGWSLAGIEIHEIPTEILEQRVQTVLRPDEVELEEVLRPLLDDIERVQPRRAVIDGLSELRVLARDALRFREQIHEIKRRITHHHGTLLLLDHLPLGDPGSVPPTYAQGVIELDRSVLDYGSMRRRLLVHKMRGARFREGWHDLQIAAGGLVVFPRLPQTAREEPGERGVITLGDDRIDRLVGGVARGSAVLVIGASGTGKSTLAAQCVQAAAARGEGAAIFLFDERRETFLARAAAAGRDLGPHLAEGRVSVQPINPPEVQPGQLAAMVREAVEARRVGIVVIDSLDGYFASTPGERFSLLYLRELFSWLGARGVTSISTLQQHDDPSPPRDDPSRLADVVLRLRFFEATGRVRKAISVVKNRAAPHGPAICELRIDAEGVHAGEPLVDFQGVLTGTPVYLGTEAQLEAAEGHGRARP